MKINFVVASIVFVVTSQELYRLTMSLRGMLLPDDRTRCLAGAAGVGTSILVFYVLAWFLVPVLEPDNDADGTRGTSVVTLAVLALSGTTLLLIQHVLKKHDKADHNGSDNETEVEAMRALLGSEGKGIKEDQPEKGNGAGGDLRLVGTEGPSPGKAPMSTAARPSVLVMTVVGVATAGAVSLGRWYMSTHPAVRLMPPILLNHPATPPTGASDSSPNSRSCVDGVNQGSWSAPSSALAGENIAVSSSSVWSWSIPGGTASKCPKRARMGADAALKLLQGKTVLVVGDSVARSLFHAVARAMGDRPGNSHNATSPRHADIEATFGIGASLPSGNSRGSSGNLRFLWAPFASNVTHRLQGYRDVAPDVVLASTGLWDALHGRNETAFAETLSSLRQMLHTMHKGRSSDGASESPVVLWLANTVVVDSRLLTEDKRIYMNEAKVARYRAIVTRSGILTSVDGVVDGQSMTQGQDLASIDGVHYSEVVYDAMAQVGLPEAAAPCVALLGLLPRFTCVFTGCALVHRSCSINSTYGGNSTPPVLDKYPWRRRSPCILYAKMRTPGTGSGFWQSQLSCLSPWSYFLCVLVHLPCSKTIFNSMYPQQDNFFGIPTLVTYLLGGATLTQSVAWETAYGPLLTKIGMRPRSACSLWLIPPVPMSCLDVSRPSSSNPSHDQL